MSLNCQPGDLARVVDDPEARRAGIVDKILRVETAQPLWSGETAWSYEGPALRCVCPCRRELVLIGDSLLRPIRGQAGDDETLAWAGKPEHLTEPAAA